MPNQQWTYATLETALQEWPENDNDRYVENIPNLIGLGELRLVRDLDLEIFDTEDDTILLTIGSRLVDKPDNCLVVRDVGLVDPVLGYIPLKQRSLQFCKQYAPLPATQATPQYYHENSPTQILVVDTPDAALVVHFHMMARPADLLDPSTPNDTSWLSTRVPDALFAACLMEAEHYTQADDRYNDFKTKYDEELLPAARYELRQLRRSGDYSPFEPAARSK